MTGYKQALVLREDLDMSPGKMIAQACHASLKVYKKAEGDKKQVWENGGAKKIVLGAGDHKLEELHQRCKKKGIPACIVTDAGMTELEPGTKTALGVGPDEESKIDTVTGNLKLIE